MWLNANKQRLWCERKGQGEPLLVITGTGGDLRKSPNILSSPLPNDFDVAAFDQRGLGQSDKPDGPYEMAEYAADAVGILDELGWPTAHVLGISFGGMVAQEVAIRHAARVRRLVLCCTSPGGAGGSSYPIHELFGLPAEERARRMTSLGDTRRDLAWGRDNPELYAQLVAQAANEAYASEPRFALGRAAQLEARKAHDTWDRLPGIRSPTLICAGRYDGIATPDTQRLLATHIPQASMEFYDGGHSFLFQDPRGFADIVAFLKR